MCFRSKVYEGVAHILLAVAASIPAIAHAQGLAGTWIGRATYRGDDLPIELTFEITSSGPQGLLTAPTIRAHRYPLRNVALSTNEVSFDLVADASTFKFVGHVAGSTLMGTWNLFGVGAEVVATRGAARTVPYARESVSCRNGDVTLAGTLLVPSGPGPHPAVVFAHGSGPETRDASSFLADQLARRQIVVLTFDKRGTGASTVELARELIQRQQFRVTWHRSMVTADFANLGHASRMPSTSIEVKRSPAFLTDDHAPFRNASRQR